jgi:uncharacterized membrane protein
MVLFLPGYALIAALFPRKNDLDGIERLALSFGLSIAVVPLIGLGLNFTPFGIRLVPILVSLSVFTMAMLLIANLRRSQMSEEERFEVPFSFFIYVFFFKKTGDNLKLEFLLYKEDNITAPYRDLHLWVNVSSTSS